MEVNGGGNGGEYQEGVDTGSEDKSQRTTTTGTTTTSTTQPSVVGPILHTTNNSQDANVEVNGAGNGGGNQPVEAQKKPHNTNNLSHRVQSSIMKNNNFCFFESP